MSVIYWRRIRRSTARTRSGSRSRSGPGTRTPGRSRACKANSPCLRAAIAQTAGILADDRDPKSAAYRTAGAFVAHADLFGISDISGQAAPLAALRALATPRPVYLLLRNGSLVSVHFTLSEAQQEAIRRGADPASWDVSDSSPEGALAAYHAAWCISGRQLDAAAPWMTLGATPSSVFVVREPSGLPHSVHSTEATARRLAADAGIPVTDRSLIRVTVSSALSPATV